MKTKTAIVIIASTILICFTALVVAGMIGNNNVNTGDFITQQENVNLNEFMTRDEVSLMILDSRADLLEMIQDGADLNARTLREVIATFDMLQGQCDTRFNMLRDAVLELDEMVYALR